MEPDQLKQEIKLIEEVGKFTHNPYGFVMYSFEWGKGELEKYKGPEKWQEDVLKSIGEKLEQGRMGVYEAILEAVASGHGVGKILSNVISVDTPDGLKRWGDIQVGDFVFGKNGNPVKVVNKFPYRDWKFYKISFSDGTQTYAGLEHQWVATTRADRDRDKAARVVTTEEMMKNIHRKYQIPMCKAVEYEETPLPINPYLLGYILGNGSLRTPSAVKVSCFDEELYEHMENMLPKELSFNGRAKNYQHISKGYDSGKEDNGLVEHLSRLDLMGVHGHDKFIPREYKYNSSKNRIELLRGLMDSDGTISKRIGDNNRLGYKVNFSTSSEKLRDDVMWIIQSLGGTAGFSSDNRLETTNYEVHINLPNSINPFFLKRKADMYEDYVNTVKRNPLRCVEKIEYDHMGEGHCITVEAEDHLYLANDFIVTHNSALVAWLILWALSTFEDTKGVVTANTETQLKTKTWAELSKWYRLCITKHWFVMTATAIFSKDKAHEKTWRFDMIPWSENKTEAFAGMHNKGKRVVVIFDEASAIPDLIWQVTEGALTDEDTEILWLVFGNPTRNTGRFHASFYGLRHRWTHQQVDSREVSLTNKEQINRWVEDYGEDSDFVRVRVKGTFPRASDHQFIPTDIVEEARGKHLRDEQYNFAAVIIGVDRAWSGDETKIWLRQGLMSKRLGTFNKGEDDFLIAGHLAKWEDEYGADAVFIDFGYGTGVYSAGKQMNRNWRMVNFGSAPIDIRYAEKRGEIWGLMKEWLKGGGAIPDDNDICSDLVAPEAFEVQTGPRAGRLRLESKEDMKKRGLPSPDDGDGLALTFSFPIMNKSQKHFNKLLRKGQKYDPLKLNTGQQQQQYNPLSPLAKV